jgi:anaerobic magnesium-protoporphyrin IX monomethyl ester cyclase
MCIDSTCDALFVGYEKQENLGLRYVMGYLQARGHRTALVPFNPQDPATVVEAAVANRPALIGFSILFQYTLHEFRPLMEALRNRGIRAHFTAGGHFPSLRPKTTFVELPELDSVVRFEGELTAQELLVNVKEREAWRQILGLAFRDGNQIVVNPPRPLVPELDRLPWPVRGGPQHTIRGMFAAPMLASRGCCYDCSFCSIRQFYGSAPGALRRSRSPRDVAAEMADLNLRAGVRLFIFHDDDFAAKTVQQRKWIDGFLHELEQAGLHRRIGWKVSSRVDDVDADVLIRCRDHGLLAVYVGVESGNDQGLRTLNKRVTVAQNLKALRTLRAIDMPFDLGFMLFDPDSTFETVRTNLHFLRAVASMGGVPICFAKTVPLAGTALEQQLAEAGRLIGTEVRPDYDLLDPRLDHYALFVTLNFSFRNSDPNGVVERLRAASFDRALAETFQNAPRGGAYEHALHVLIDCANHVALDTLETALDFVERLPLSRESVPLVWPQLTRIAAHQHRVDAQILAELNRVMDAFNPELAQLFREQDAVQSDHNYVLC